VLLGGVVMIELGVVVVLAFGAREVEMAPASGEASVRGKKAMASAAIKRGNCMVE
jgi:hypothetical protein